MSKRSAAEELIKAQDAANTLSQVSKMTEADGRRVREAAQRYDSNKSK